MRDILSLADQLAAPTVQLVAGAHSSRSYLGGEPILSDLTQWPTCDGDRLGFLAQIDMQTVQTALPIQWLPPAGRLLFFYDIDGQPSGTNPADANRAAVLWLNDGDESPRYEGHQQCLDLDMRSIRTLPGPRRKSVGNLALTSAELDRYWELAHDRYGQELCHQMGGFPLPVQGDHMELSCQLLNNGMAADSRGFHDPRVAGLEQGALEWRLLLQLDSDNRVEFLWGDEGRLYFWIREADARKRDFSKVRCILQCS